MPRSIRFYTRNRWVESATIITSSGSQPDSDAGEAHDPSRTQTPDLDSVWWSSGLTSVYLSADLGQARKIGAVAFARCNLTNGGTYRIRVSSSPIFATSLYDSGTRTRTRYYGDLEIATAKTSEFFSSGTPNVDTRKLLQSQVTIVELPSEVTGQYVRIDFNDASNTDNYIGVGAVYAGRILQPDHDLLFNWKIQRDHIVRNGQASCGQYWSASVRHRTLVEFSLAPQKEADVLAYWFLLQSLVGVNDPFFISLLDRTDSWNFTTSLYARFVEVPIISAIAYRHYSMPMRVEELTSAL